MAVVMIEVLHQHCFELTSVEDQHPVETLSTDGADEALGEGVGPRGSDRRADDLDPLRPEDFVETGRELGVSVPDEEPDGLSTIDHHHGRPKRTDWPARSCSNRTILSGTALGLFTRQRVWKLTPKCQHGVSLQG